LADELKAENLRIRRQVAVPLVVDGKRFKEGFQADIVVNDSILLELKSVQVLDRTYFKQTLTYTKILDYRLGLLINFGTDKLEVKRIVNRFVDQ
jgi:GxxExxY protein